VSKFARKHKKRTNLLLLLLSFVRDRRRLRPAAATNEGCPRGNLASPINLSVTMRSRLAAFGPSNRASTSQECVDREQLGNSLEVEAKRCKDRSAPDNGADGNGASLTSSS